MLTADASRLPAEGRLVRRYTSAAANSYPLYYFVPSITVDQRYLVFHSERSGSVQLWRLDLVGGSTLQLTHGNARDAGWAIWCEYRLNGIYNHLSCLDPVRGEVFYFDERGLHGVDVSTGSADRVLIDLSGRMPLGQSAVSPDGSIVAFIDADRDAFLAATGAREAAKEAGLFTWAEHDAWRLTLPTRINVVDVRTGALTVVRDLDFHVHHLLFVDDQTLLINHERSGNGMWTIGLGDGPVRSLRPRDTRGGVCHQVVAGRVILYETSVDRGSSWFGRYALDTDTWQEWELPADIGYVHTGNDPQGSFFVIEACSASRHALYVVRPEPDSERADVELLHELNPKVYDELDQQRYHAHPFLSPDRQQLFFTDVVDGYSQVCSIDVADLTR